VGPAGTHTAPGQGTAGAIVVGLEVGGLEVVELGGG
jgi:hypothetical protein